MTSIFGWRADDYGCGYFRLSLPLDIIKKDHPDWRIEHHTRMPDWVRDSCDIIIAQRTCMPGPSQLWQSLCSSGKHTTVYEVDDDLFNVDPCNVAAHNVYTTPSIRDAIIANAAAADVVTVSTEPLADVMRPINPNVVVIPNRIPGWLLDRPAPTDGNPLIVGWGGSGSHIEDVAECSSEVKRFIARTPNVELHLMGSPFKSFGPARVSGWSDGVDDYLKNIDFNIGLAPLKPSVFNRSKSDLRLLELSALGIPTIASDTGPYAESKAPAIRVRRPHEWSRALRDLVSDPELRTSLGSEAREFARGQTVEHWAWCWLDAWGTNGNL